jgi:hypothetical protein
MKRGAARHAKRVSRRATPGSLLLAKGRAAGARFACPSGSRQPVADRVASWDQEHPRRQALPARLLHQQSAGALTGCEASPSHGRRSRNRLVAVVSAPPRPAPARDELQSSAPARDSRLLSAGLRASPSSTDQTPAIEGSGPARTRTTLTRPRDTAPRVLPYACPAALTRSARGAPVVSDVILRLTSQTTGANPSVPVPAGAATLV